MLNGEPIGYAQSYVALGSGDGWWEEETDPGVRGIDQSLANASQLGKGLGTKLVRALVELLFNDPEVTKIQNGPVAEQLASDPMLPRKGVERQGTVTTPDGPAVYMVQTRCIRANTQCCLNPSIEGDVQGLEPLAALVKR